MRTIMGAILACWFCVVLTPGAAKAACLENDRRYSDGAAVCLPALHDGALQKVLHVCDGDTWQPQQTVCPDAFRYFCTVGPYAVKIGERILVGSGPLALECRFPGEFALTETHARTRPAATTDEPAARAAPSETVRAVQRFLSGEEAGGVLDCGGSCSGRPDAATRRAMIAFLRGNLENMTDEERQAWGFASADEIAGAVARKSPIDLYPQFVTTFDVPRGQ